MPLVGSTWTLLVHFLQNLPAGVWTAQSLTVSGGLLSPAATVNTAPLATGKVLSVTVTLIRLSATWATTYTTPYTLTLAPLSGFDPQSSSVQFLFFPSTPTGVDCQATATVPPVTPSEPQIDYLAKDYASFRQP